MSYYRECPYCGCNLDPGERCDCQTQTKKEPAKIAAKPSVEAQSKSNEGKKVWM